MSSSERVRGRQRGSLPCPPSRSDYEAITKLTDGFNGADLRNVATEAGMFAIREDRDYTLQE